MFIAGCAVAAWDLLLLAMRYTLSETAIHVLADSSPDDPDLMALPPSSGRVEGQSADGLFPGEVGPVQQHDDKHRDGQHCAM